VMIPEITIRDVSKTFETADGPVHAFGPSSLEVAPGEFVSLLGPSGCGKSTLMLMVAGLLPVSSGEILARGVCTEAPRTDIGIMFQDNALVPWRTVRGNIELQLELRGLDVAQYRQRVSELIASVQLDGFAERYPHELSGGMQQRAALCQTLVHQPTTLLLDEPLGKLDAMTRESIRGDLQALWMEQKPTVIFVTHSIEEAVLLGDRIVVMSARPGRIRAVYDVRLERPRTAETRSLPEFVRLSQDLWHSLKPEWQEDAKAMPGVG